MVTETIKTTMKEFAGAVRDAVEASLGEGYQVQILSMDSTLSRCSRL